MAADITQDENDQYQLEPMVEQLKDNIDLGEENIDAYISMFNRSEKTDLGKNKFHKENFEFDEDNDIWVCPARESLEFMREFIRDGKKYTQYGCKLKKYVFCHEREVCIITKEDIRRGYRTIEDDGYVVYRQEMRKKMSGDNAKAIYSKRAGSIEPVFGQIKNNRNFTRFRLKGLLKVKLEFLIMTIKLIYVLMNANKVVMGERNSITIKLCKNLALFPPTPLFQEVLIFCQKIHNHYG
ncbi:MAG: transposase [Spirochaetota bacterium]|nr:transposase [Spirochaetota bacterium]